jgi:hypothetical protein
MGGPAGESPPFRATRFAPATVALLLDHPQREQSRDSERLLDFAANELPPIHADRPFRVAGVACPSAELG